MVDTIDIVAPILNEGIPAPDVAAVPAAPEDKDVVLKQSRLNDIIKDAQSRAAKELRQRVAELERETEHHKAIAAGSAEGSTELDKARAELSAARMEVDSIKATAQKQSRDAFITSLASKHDFIDPDVITKLTRDNLQWNGTGYTVLDDTGNPRTAADGSPLSPEAFYAEYAQQRLYLVKGKVLSGGGGTSSVGAPVPATVPLTYYFGPKSNSAAVNALSINRPDEYRRLRREAVKEGLVAGSN